MPSRFTGLVPLFLTAAGVARAHPVPDYAPLHSVVVHQQLSELAPKFVEALRETLGHRLRVEDYDPGELRPEDGILQTDPSLLWMRDYQLLYRRDADGTLSGLRYGSENPNRAEYLADRAERLGLIHENGNLVVTGAWVIVGERIFGDNPGLTRQTVLSTLAKAIGHPVGQIVVLPALPNENTGHVDLFVLPLGDSTVLVPYIERAAVVDRHDDAVAQIAERARVFLDTQAHRLSGLHLKVVRVPMLPPLQWVSPDDGELDTIYFSPANALLTDFGEGRRTAWVPKANGRVLRPVDRIRQRRYLRATSRALQANGWQARMVDATALGRYLGLFRCVTASVPKP
jgi:hypothetical protein